MKRREIEFSTDLVTLYGDAAGETMGRWCKFIFKIS